MNKKLFFALFVFVFLSATMIGQSTKINKGDAAEVPEWTWITIMNPDGIESGNMFFEFEESAGIETPGIVTVVGFHENLVLVKYHISGTVFGTRCPNGAIFFLEQKVFSDWRSGRADRIKAEKRTRKDLVKKILSGK
jgi:hypothetical protein